MSSSANHRPMASGWQHSIRGVTRERTCASIIAVTFGDENTKPGIVAKVSQILGPLAAAAGSPREGFRRRIEIRGVPTDATIFWRLLPEQTAGSVLTTYLRQLPVRQGASWSG